LGRIRQCAAPPQARGSRREGAFENDVEFIANAFGAGRGIGGGCGRAGRVSGDRAGGNHNEAVTRRAVDTAGARKS